MSAETVLPPEGPVGPETDPQQETSRLLPSSTQGGACNNDSCESPDATSTTKTRSPGEPQSSATLEHVTGGGHTHENLVRTQPRPLPPLSTSSSCEGDPARLQNGLPVAMGNGHGGARPGATAAVEPRKQHMSPVSQKMQRKLRSSLSVNSDSSRKSKGSSTGSHKPGSSPEDCCVHCILACLFCEFLTLCNMVVAQASCGTCTSEACCCCCCADDLGDDCNCPCDMDCGIMDACCESSDCLEICMECCGICFPT
ncbi:hypothetical protein AALO_G00222620 [Alosa alosa]|uniref:MyoD family inhibitor domain-containing protein n=1 Tax=Alosa alosa TaxID=278164 RepID=A0AAV6FXK3_9TELE|nr:myoD family inhibitor domain-containing protein [Alosa sapidissima]XP_048123483.1 myoD family inhibitor domain-containing protein [Alosa alosa]KAG5267518.1 hypothetical protein AALO_G00222620 [Alosa alosa]